MSWGSPGEIGARSSSGKSYVDETSFMALQLRALGALKLGAGIALLGVSMLGVSGEEAQGAAHRLAETAAAKTEPKPQPKPVVYPPGSRLPQPPAS